MLEQIDKLQRRLKTEEIDCLLISSPANRRYVSGFTGTFGYCLLAQDEAWFLTDSRYVLQAKKQTKGLQVQLLEHFDVALAVKKLMDSRELDTLAIEAEYVTVDFYQNLCSQFGRRAIVPISGWIEEMRMIKSEHEISLIAQAEHIGDMAFEHILDYIKPGVSEKDIALELEYFMKKQGASSTSFDTIVASGARSEMPHGVAGDKLIEMGDLVTLDYGCIYQGYCSDMTRTVAVGSITQEQRETYDLVLKAQNAAIEAIKAGVIGKDVDEVARKIFHENNVGYYFGHSLGHSLGLEIHEEPRFSPAEKRPIAANTVLSVEPGLYRHGYGVRIEDIVVVRENGAENLTHSLKDLIIL